MRTIARLNFALSRWIRARRRRSLEQHLRELDAIVDDLRMKHALSKPERKMLELCLSEQAWIVERLRGIPA